MAASSKGKGIASGTIATDTDTSAQATTVDATTTSLKAYMTVSSRTDGTFTLKIEESHDGSNWEQLVASSGVTTNDTVYIDFQQEVDGAFFSKIRITVTSASTTSGATVEAGLFYGE
jgi:hypothetical protein